MKSLSSKKREKGQGLVEYALILVLVAIVVIAAVTLLGPSIGNIFSSVNGSLTSTGGGNAALVEATKAPIDCTSLKDAYDNSITAYNVCGGDQNKCPSQYATAHATYNAWHACLAQQ